VLTNGYIPGRGHLSDIYREYDPFEKWEDFDPSIEVTDDIAIGVNVFQLVREVRNRINGWANRVRPSYFMIGANSERKTAIYERACELLARRIRGYSVQYIGDTFYFFRINTPGREGNEESIIIHASKDTGSKLTMYQMITEQNGRL
jgi:hypothetical protein